VDTQNGFGVSFTVTLGLSDEAGHDRVMDASIEENTIVGAAVVESVEKTKRALIVGEDNLTGGRGAELAACIGESLFHGLEYPLGHVAAPDTTAALRSRANTCRRSGSSLRLRGRSRGANWRLLALAPKQKLSVEGIFLGAKCSQHYN